MVKFAFLQRNKEWHCYLLHILHPVPDSTLEHKFEKGAGDGKNGISMVKEENNR
jgi:hypothetical protein